MSRILWIFARILWATLGYSGYSPGQSGRQLFSGTSGETGLTGLSDRSDWSNPVTSFYPLCGVKQSKSLTFHHNATDSFLLSPVRRPSSTLLSIFTPLEIWSSSPCFGCFITCIGARRGKSISGEAGFEVPHEFISLPRYHMFPSPDLLAQRISFQSLWSSRFCQAQELFPKRSRSFVARIARNQILGFGRHPTGLTGLPELLDRQVQPEPKTISLSHTLLCKVLDNLNIVYQSSLAFFLNKDHQNRVFLQSLSRTGLTGL